VNYKLVCVESQTAPECPTFPDLVEEFRMQYSPSWGSPRGLVALNNLKQNSHC
jgi:hypothetical protein